MDQATRQRHRGATQVFFGDILAERCFDQRRPGGEDRPLVSHHSEIGQWRAQRPMPGGRAQYGDGKRHTAGRASLSLQVAGGTSGWWVVGEWRPVPSSFQQHHQRDAFLEGEFRDPVPFRRLCPADRSAGDSEILRSDSDRTAINHADTSDETINPATGKLPDLGKRTAINQHFDSAAGVRFAVGFTFGEFLVSPHRSRGLAFLEEPSDTVLPLAPFTHDGSPVEQFVVNGKRFQSDNEIRRRIGALIGGFDPATLFTISSTRAFMLAFAKWAPRQ